MTWAGEFIVSLWEPSNRVITGVMDRHKRVISELKVSRESLVVSPRLLVMDST